MSTASHGTPYSDFKGHGLNRTKHTGSSGTTGTGFGPYPNQPKASGALAREGIGILKTIVTMACFAALFATTVLPAQQEKPW